jgi:hypothetical protein
MAVCLPLEDRRQMHAHTNMSSPIRQATCLHQHWDGGWLHVVQETWCCMAMCARAPGISHQHTSFPSHMFPIAGFPLCPLVVELQTVRQPCRPIRSYLPRSTQWAAYGRTLHVFPAWTPSQAPGSGSVTQRQCWGIQLAPPGMRAHHGICERYTIGAPTCKSATTAAHAQVTAAQ